MAWAHVDPDPYTHGPHIDLMAEYLEAFIAGEIPRLLINIPPGHMKSIMSSVMLNAWTWTTKPEKRFVGTSYRDKLAQRDAEKCRNLVQSAWYMRRWGTRAGGLREESFQIEKDMVSRFTNDKGGYRFSCSVRSVMGEGGDFVIFDDPHNVETAESPEVLKKTVSHIRLALPTRVRSTDGGVLVIMQRLSEADYAGHMIASETGCEHLCLPARYESDHPYVSLPHCLVSSKRELPGDFREEDGELLFEERFDEKKLIELEIELAAYGAAGQLQQRPAPRTGGMFQRSDFKVIDRMFDGPRIEVRGWDLASTQGGGKYTAGVKIACVMKPDGSFVLVVMHVVRDQWSSHNVDLEMRLAAKNDGRYVMQDIPQDPGQAGKAQKSSIAANLAEDADDIKFSPETGSKETRAKPWSSQSEAGNIYLLRGDWNDAYIDEHALFPNGTYTDQVDASSRAYARILVERKKLRRARVGVAPQLVQA